MSALEAQPLVDTPQNIAITELERAINYWRAQYPSSRDTMTLCSQASCLAELYAQMIIYQMHEISITEFSEKARQALEEALRGTLKGTSQLAKP